MDDAAELAERASSLHTLALRSLLFVDMLHAGALQSLSSPTPTSSLSSFRSQGPGDDGSASLVRTLSSLRKRIVSELPLVEAMVGSKTPLLPNKIRSSNLHVLAAVVATALKCEEHLVGVQTTVRVGSGRDCLRSTVDIITEAFAPDGSPLLTWAKVKVGLPHAIHNALGGHGRFDTGNSLREQAETLLAAAQNAKVGFAPPRIVFLFVAGVSLAVAHELEALGIVVSGRRINLGSLADVAPHSDMESLPPILPFTSRIFDHYATLLGDGGVGTDASNDDDNVNDNVNANDDANDDASDANDDDNANDNVNANDDANDDASDTSDENAITQSQLQELIAQGKAVIGPDGQPYLVAFEEEYEYSLYSDDDDEDAAAADTHAADADTTTAASNPHSLTTPPTPAPLSMAAITALCEQLVAPLPSSSSLSSGQNTSSSSSSSISASPKKMGLNLDVSAVIALVSDVCQPEGRMCDFTDEILQNQALAERSERLLPRLERILEGKKLYMCETAVASVHAILQTVAGPSEIERTHEFLKSITVVPDTVSDRISGLRSTTRIKDRARVIFGVGDALGVPTLTANSSFIRAAKQQGVHIHAITVDARALTESRRLSSLES